MTRKDQIKILINKIEANKAQYNLDRQNAEISAYSDGNLNKYEYLTNKDLGYKRDALQQARFEYSPLGNFFYGKPNNQEDKSQRTGLFQTLKNIENNTNKAKTKTQISDAENEKVEDEKTKDEEITKNLIDILKKYTNKRIDFKYKKKEGLLWVEGFIMH